MVTMRRLLCSFIVIHQQDEQQLSVADLWSFDDKGATHTQFRVGLEQKLQFFVELQLNRVASVGLALSVDVESEVLAGGEPIFLAGLECLARLTNNLELVVAEKTLQRLLDVR